MSKPFYVVGVTFPRDNNSASKVYYYKCPDHIYTSLGYEAIVNSPISGETKVKIVSVNTHPEMTPSKSILGVIIRGEMHRIVVFPELVKSTKEKRLEDLLSQAEEMKKEIQDDEKAKLRKEKRKQRQHYKNKMQTAFLNLHAANLAREDFLVVKRMIIDMEKRANG